MRFYLMLTVFLLMLTGVNLATAEGQYLQGRVIQGPYKTKIANGGELSVLETGDKNFPLSLVLDVIDNNGEKNRQLVDKYDVAGSAPKVESVFTYPVKGKINILVLVSWELTSRGIGTYGMLYQVFGYHKDPDNKLSANKLIKFDKVLSGIEGYQEGNPQSFRYKNAAEIKTYIKKFIN